MIIKIQIKKRINKMKEEKRQKLIKEILKIRKEMTKLLCFPEPVPKHITKGHKEYVNKLDDVSLEAEYEYCKEIRQETISKSKLVENTVKMRMENLK